MKKNFLLMVFALALFSQKSNAQSWSLSGNAGTTTSNYLGTTDSKDLLFKTNAATRMTISSSGYTGFGITPETNSRLYSTFTTPTIFAAGTLYSSTKGRLLNGTATTANGYLGVYGSFSQLNLTTLPLSMKYMGVLGVKEQGADFGAGVVGWNKNGEVGGKNYGVCGLANGYFSGTFGTADDANVGLYGSASNGFRNIAIYGNAPGTGDWAGYFNGRGYFANNVAIGTQVTTSMLTVDAPASTNILSLRSNAIAKMVVNENGYLGLGTASPASYLDMAVPASVAPLKITIGGTTRFQINSAGRVGIGTLAPTSRFYVKTTNDNTCGYFNNVGSTTAAVIGIDNITQNLGGPTFGVNSNATGTGENYAVVGKAIQNGTLNRGVWGEAKANNTGDAVGVYGVASGGSSNSPAYGVYGTASGSSNFWAGYFNGTTYAGSLRVGTTDAASGYIASIGGKMICEEVRVALEADWPDYVFSDNHELMDLDILKDHLKENKHLPGIPSAAEIKKEGGFELGDMQKKLLEKVEELTLYVIKLNDENKQLRTEVDQLKK